MTDIERIEAVINWSGLSENAFAKKIGYSSGGSIYNKINGNRDINIKFITKIANTFPEINKTWILTGIGNMLTNSNTVIQRDKQPQNQPNNNSKDELMTPERFDRLLDLMEDQQKAINSLIENQSVLASKIPDHQKLEKLSGRGA